MNVSRIFPFATRSRELINEFTRRDISEPILPYNTAVALVSRNISSFPKINSARDTYFFGIYTILIYHIYIYSIFFI